MGKILDLDGGFNMIRIAKRDKTIVPFNKQKIISAINKAFLEVDGTLYETDTSSDIASDIEEILYHIDETTDTPVTVEQVQDLVEDFLMRSERRDVAKSYIRYRYKKEVARNHSDEFITAIAQKLNAADVQNQNANIDEHSFGGRIGEASNVLMEKYALEYCVSKRTRKNHLENRIYIHDLNSYAVGMHNCLSIPIDDLAAKGFNTRQTDVRPARSINTFCQLCAVVMQLQSLQQFGGVSYTHLDWSAVPYIRMSFTKHLGDGLIYIEKKSEYKTKRFHKWLENDEAHPDGTIHFDDEEFKALHPEAWEYAMDMTIKEIHQAVEGLYHNLNTLQSRSGNQLPFTSINYGTCTLPEGREFTKALLEVSIEGLGALHKTSIFPCGIFQCMKGVNRKPGDPNYDLFKLALRSTAQRLYPNYANVDWSGNAGYDINDPRTYFSTMGCRTANGWDVNGFGQLKDGRGNIAPTTIILPTVAMEAKEVFDKGDGYIDTPEGSKQFIDYFLITSTSSNKSSCLYRSRFSSLAEIHIFIPLASDVMLASVQSSADKSSCCGIQPDIIFFSLLSNWQITCSHLISPPLYSASICKIGSLQYSDLTTALGLSHRTFFFPQLVLEMNCVFPSTMRVNAFSNSIFYQNKYLISL